VFLGDLGHDNNIDINGGDKDRRMEIRRRTYSFETPIVSGLAKVGCVEAWSDCLDGDMVRFVSVSVSRSRREGRSRKSKGEGGRKWEEWRKPTDGRIVKVGVSGFKDKDGRVWILGEAGC